MTAAAAPTLCLVTDRRRLCAASARALDAGHDLVVAQAEAASSSGVDIFQVREHDLGAAALYRLVERVRAVAGTMRVLVNDRADVAAAAGAGVHLRGTSIPAARLRAWLPASTCISAAVHAASDIEAMAGADLLVAGTVQRSRSKGETSPLLGFDGLAAVVRATDLPVLGIGGLSAADAAAIRLAGAKGIAAVDFFLPRPGESPGHAVQRAAIAWRAAAGPWA